MAAPAAPDPRAERVGELMASFAQDSALMIAHERDLESGRADALFEDPLAKYLVGPVDESGLSKGARLSEAFGKRSAAQFGFGDWEAFHTQWTACRTRFIDDAIGRAVASDKPQFVNLGAGFDTRSYRLSSFGEISASFEVDVEAVNDAKDSVFGTLCADTWKPLCDRKQNVTCDLMVEGDLGTKLAGAGFAADRRSIFLAEGLIMYLGARQLPFLQEVSAIAGSGSTLILNFMTMSPADIEKLRASVGDAAADGAAKMVPSKEKFRDTLIEGGWTDIEIVHWGEPALNFGRFPLDKFAPSQGWSFAVARKP